ncbi:putative surface protein with fasciclin (FAS1) repeats [Ulvibacter sp. MAR_2010_11]|uniref:fasciclin domain-containing protein n=1 Tax=Ulvibacter sp. MAR_2010_11 TaxID=1250229 RepID=UPI000C2C9FCB|nr:fasciclin domain-containing protein [Ulvibacter sp. MAR_2010_11]PKA82258.1 putative surface protein with fasciclin (FAS1) repeats [Ulvibacter sp. MAR_2010_11]
MNYIKRFLCICAVLAVVSACKNDAKDTNAETMETKADTVAPKVKKIPTEAEKAQTKSVMSKVMVTPELKTFASFLVSAGMTDILMKEQGPYTVLAPTTAAFDAMEKAKRESFLNPKNKEALVAMLKMHIVEGNHDSVSLVQNIKTNGGSYVLTTISGATLKVTKKGSDIVVTGINGEKGIVGKSDIKANNGVVHTLDTVFLAD